MEHVANIVIADSVITRQVVLDRELRVRPVVRAKIHHQRTPVSIQLAFNGDVVVSSTSNDSFHHPLSARRLTVENGIQRWTQCDGETVARVLNSNPSSLERWLKETPTHGLLPSGCGWDGCTTPAGSMRRRLVRDLLEPVVVSLQESMGDHALYSTNADMPKCTQGPIPESIDFTPPVGSPFAEVVWVLFYADNRIGVYNNPNAPLGVPVGIVKAVKIYTGVYTLNDRHVGLRWEIYRSNSEPV